MTQSSSNEGSPGRATSPPVEEWVAHPEKFLGHPKLPKYREKQGRNLLTYTTQAISRHPRNAGWIVPSGLAIRVATKHSFQTIAQVRIAPHATHYTVEVIYEQEIFPADVDPQWVAGIDLGVNNLAALTANQPGFTPLLVNGRPLKALNQLYNKRRAHYQALLPEGQYTSHRLDVLTNKRIMLQVLWRAFARSLNVLCKTSPLQRHARANRSQQGASCHTACLEPRQTTTPPRRSPTDWRRRLFRVGFTSGARSMGR